MGTMKLTDAKLDQLAKDPLNIVYKFKGPDRLDATKVIPISTIRVLIPELWCEFKLVKTTKLGYELRAKMSPVNERKARWWLLTKSPNKTKWGCFNETHPLIFDRCTQKDTTMTEIDTMLRMIDIREQEDRGEIDDGKRIFQNYVVETFATYKEKQASVTIEEVSPDAPHSSATIPDDQSSATTPGVIPDAPESSTTIPDDQSSTTIPVVIPDAPESSTTIPDDQSSATIPGVIPDAPESSTTTPDDQSSATIPGVIPDAPESSTTIPRVTPDAPESSTTIPDDQSSATIPQHHPCNDP